MARINGGLWLWFLAWLPALKSIKTNSSVPGQIFCSEETPELLTDQTCMCWNLGYWMHIVGSNISTLFHISVTVFWARNIETPRSCHKCREKSSQCNKLLNDKMRWIGSSSFPNEHKTNKLKNTSCCFLAKRFHKSFSIKANLMRPLVLPCRAKVPGPLFGVIFQDHFTRFAC